MPHGAGREKHSCAAPAQHVRLQFFFKPTDGETGHDLIPAEARVGAGGTMADERGVKRRRTVAFADTEVLEVEADVGEGGGVFPKLGEWECVAQDAIRIRLVRDVSGMDDPSGDFAPEYTHQVFGVPGREDDEDESGPLEGAGEVAEGEGLDQVEPPVVIHGYKGLRVLLRVNASTLHCWCEMSWEARQTGLRSQVDDVQSILSATAFSRAPLLPSRAAFEATLAYCVGFSPHAFGELVEEWETEGNSAGEPNQAWATYQVNLSDAPEAVRSWHKRAEPFVMLFIDAASFLDHGDPGWRLHVTFERFRLRGSSRRGFAFAGLATAYSFYVFPQGKRLRISQVLVLPPFQRRGLASCLLGVHYTGHDETAEITDVTLEAPTEDMQRIRDRVDLERLGEAESRVGFYGATAKATAAARSAQAELDITSAHLKFPSALGDLAQKELLMPRKQAARLWEASLHAWAGVTESDTLLDAVRAVSQRRIHAEIFRAGRGGAGTQTSGGDPANRPIKALLKVGITDAFLLMTRCSVSSLAGGAADMVLASELAEEAAQAHAPPPDDAADELSAEARTVAALYELDASAYDALAPAIRRWVQVVSR